MMRLAMAVELGVEVVRQDKGAGDSFLIAVTQAKENRTNDLSQPHQTNWFRGGGGGRHDLRKHNFYTISYL